MQGTKIILLEMVVVVLLLSSCTSASMHGVVAYDSFPKEISLKADSVPTQKVYDNVFVALNEGKFIVSSFKADTMMHFYSIPDLKYDYSLGVKGQVSLSLLYGWLCNFMWLLLSLPQWKKL